MGVDVRVVEWPQAQGHDAIHLRDEGLQRAPDDQIFEKAIAEGRVSQTFDLDFADLVALAGGGLRVSSCFILTSGGDGERSAGTTDLRIRTGGA